MLAGKHIVVGITGGIAAYKIPMLIRLLKKEGAQVKVCATKNALEFVTPTVLETLSDNAVYTDIFAPHKEHQTEHISLPEWADMMIVAPCTANMLGKFANGIADDALSTTFLAMLKPVLIVPAMNENMLAHPATQKNLQQLGSFPNVSVLNCGYGFLACGKDGNGRMAEPEQIIQAADSMLEKKTLRGKKILITAGPTQEQIDPVRYISNYSSGKMGYAIADLCQKRGATVTLVSGPTTIAFAPQEDTTVVNVQTAQEMATACKEYFPDCDIAILTAAVADFTPKEKAEQKIKRTCNELILQLNATTDIAATLGKEKTSKQVLVGFALETQNEESNAQAKMEKKNLDIIVLNSLCDAGAGFGTDTNKVTLFTKAGKRILFPLKSKKEVARDIVEQLEEYINQ